MKYLNLLLQIIKQIRCKHVYIDLRKIGYERCIYCMKEKRKNW